MTVRDAQPRDAAEVADVHVRSWQAAYRDLFPDDYLDGLRVEDRMAHDPAGTRTWPTLASCTPAISTRKPGGEESDGL